MARGFVNQQFVQEINKNSLFGHCSPDDFVTADKEKREIEKRASLDKTKRNLEYRQIEREKKRQEYEDYLFELEEQKRLNFLDGNSYRTMGRGMVFNEPLQTRHSFPLPRGRGRLTQEEKNKIDENNFFKKEAQIKNQLQMTNGMENYNNNIMQKKYWHGEHTPPLEERSKNGSPAIAEDAESSISSLTNSPAYLSESCSEASPQPAKLEPVKKRGNRLAAKFCNAFDDNEDDGSCWNNKQSEVFMSAEPPCAPVGLRMARLSEGISFNSLNSSQRILDCEQIPMEILLNSYNKNSDCFEYKKEDFPPLK